jgi:hypothetical protein
MSVTLTTREAMYLRYCTPLRLVSMTIIENITPEKPMEHSSTRYETGDIGL